MFSSFILDQNCLLLEEFPIMPMGSLVAILGSYSCGSSLAAKDLSPQGSHPNRAGECMQKIRDSEMD